MKAYVRMEMKFYTDEFGHMTKMAAMSIHGKNFKKISSPEPCNGWTQNLVCNLGYTRTTKLLKDYLELTLTLLRQG